MAGLFGGVHRSGELISPSILRGSDLQHVAASLQGPFFRLPRPSREAPTSPKPSKIFFRYAASDLLVINTSEIDFVERSADLQQLLRRLQDPVKGTQYFLPLGPSV